MKIVSENQFSGKTYFYTIASRGHARDFELVEQVIHDCRVCGHKVQQERGAMTNHLKLSHEMSLSDYGVKYRPYKDNHKAEVEQVTSTKQWFDGCEYRCALECPHSTKSRNAMSQHLKSAHKETFQEGVNFHVIRESFMQCQICSLDMLHSEGGIRRHMTTSHSVTLEDYAEKYVTDGVIKTSAPDPLDKIKGMIVPNNIPWYDRCAYRCKSCMSIFWVVKDISGHIKKCNGGHAEKETVRNTIHNCKICGYKVLHERGSLTTHIVKRHGSSLTDYGMKYQPYKEKQKAMVKQEISTKQWYDGCEYRCALECSHISKTRNTMAQHLKSTHKEKLKEGVNFNVIKESVIQCQICSLDMFHSDGEIRRHLTRFHSMTLEDYAERYVRDGVVESSAPEPIDQIEGIMTPKNIQWYDRCAYRCKSCMVIFWNVKSVNQHIKKCNEGHAEKETVRTSIHTCKICDKRVLHERSALGSHIVNKHGMSVSDYAVKFTPYADDKPELAVETKSEEDLRWFDGCEYACLLCTNSNKTRDGFFKRFSFVSHHVSAK